MLGHIAAVGAGITLAAEHVQKNVFHRHSQRISNSFFAVVWEEPVVAGLQHHHGADLRLLMPTRGSQKRNFSLAREDLQPLFDVIDTQHLPVELQNNGIGHNPPLRFAAEVCRSIHRS